jgi:hypothetical protein
MSDPDQNPDPDPLRQKVPDPQRCGKMMQIPQNLFMKPSEEDMAVVVSR